MRERLSPLLLAMTQGVGGVWRGPRGDADGCGGGELRGGEGGVVREETGDWVVNGGVEGVSRK
jgi:hypothetical protein